jgi:hypothetical protein
LDKQLQAIRAEHPAIGRSSSRFLFATLVELLQVRGIICFVALRAHDWGRNGGPADG